MRKVRNASADLGRPQLQARCRECEYRARCGAACTQECSVCSCERPIALAEFLGGLSPDDPRMGIAARALGGLELDTHGDAPPLPTDCLIVPAVKDDHRGAALPPRDLYAVQLDAIASPTGKIRDNQDKLAEHIGLPGCSGLAVVMHEKDDYLDSLWSRLESGEVGTALAKLSPTLVVAPNYSLYLDQPRCTQLVRAKQSLVAWQFLLRSGLPSIPNLYMANEHDAFFWAVWLRNNPAVRSVAVNIQTTKSDPVWRRRVIDLTALAIHRSGRRVQVLTVGPSSLGVMRDVFARIPDAVISTSLPHHLAVSHARLLETGRVARRQQGSYATLLKDNIDAIERIAAAARDTSERQT